MPWRWRRRPDIEPNSWIVRIIACWIALGFLFIYKGCTDGQRQEAKEEVEIR